MKKFRASKKTALISAIISIVPLSISLIIELNYDKLDGNIWTYHQFGLMLFGILLFFGVVIPIFFTAGYHVSPTFMKKNIDGHVLSRFFIMKG